MQKGFISFIKSKLILLSIVFYLLVPFLIVFVSKVNVKSRTSGTYQYFENGKLASEFVLTENNKAVFKFYNTDHKTDKEYVYKEYVSNWSYRKSDWKDHYDSDKFKHLSEEYIRFGGEQSECFFIYFKIGNELYSDFLIDSSRGGGQKCYRKI